MEEPRFDSFYQFAENTKGMTTAQGLALAKEEDAILYEWLEDLREKRGRNAKKEKPNWFDYAHDLNVFLYHFQHRGFSSAEGRKLEQFEGVIEQWVRNDKCA